MASRTSTLTTTLALVALLASGESFACICRHSPPTSAYVKQRFNAVAEVFSARVVGARAIAEDVWQTELEILEVWKGTLAAHDRISIETSISNSCAFAPPAE